MLQKPRVRKPKGFILLIVVSILGLLALLAVSFMTSSQMARQLSQQYLQQSRARLLAGSGFHRGLAAMNALESPRRHYATLPLGEGTLTFHGDIVSSDAINSNDMININDGLRAGDMELGAAYNPRQVDPWPTDVEDISGLINLRLRHILNALGDVYRFEHILGWPVSDAATFASHQGAYGQSYSFTASDAGRHGRSMPANQGLGDVIVAARPDGGYRELEEIRNLVEDWGKTAAPVAGFAPGVLWKFALRDLTTLSWEDTTFKRMTREIGTYISQPTMATFDPVWIDTDPPDFTTIWAPHAVAPINLAGASNQVRAAVFYAPVNVSFLCEGVQSHPVSKNGGADHWERTSLGVGGPVFMPEALQENGVVDPLTGEDHPQVQRHRLMSLRDAMVMAQSLENWQRLENRLVDFETFRDFLDWQVDYAPANERIVDLTDQVTHPRYPAWRDGGFFKKDYLKVFLPHLFSMERRIPGWLGAPQPLLSPYIQVNEPVSPGFMGSSYGYHWEPGQKDVFYQEMLGKYALRKAEDFVRRHDAPKILFSQTGFCKIRSEGLVIASSGRVAAQSRILSTVHLGERLQLRAQREFAEFRLPETDSRILIGPEPHSQTASDHLGFVGLVDKDDPAMPGAQPHIAMMFRGNLDPEPDTAGPTAPTASGDPDLAWLVPASNPLLGSQLEGNSVSFLGKGAEGSDLNPFGGVHFSQMGHSAFADGVFNDSLYWRGGAMVFPGAYSGEEIVEEPPVPYPDYFAPFDAAVYAALATPPTERLTTWRFFAPHTDGRSWYVGRNWRGYSIDPATATLEELAWAWIVSRQWYRPDATDTNNQWNYHTFNPAIPLGGPPGFVGGVGPGAPHDIGPKFSKGCLTFWLRTPTGPFGVRQSILDADGNRYEGNLPLHSYSVFCLNLWQQVNGADPMAFQIRALVNSGQLSVVALNQQSRPWYVYNNPLSPLATAMPVFSGTSVENILKINGAGTKGQSFGRTWSGGNMHPYEWGSDKLRTKENNSVLGNVRRWGVTVPLPPPGVWSKIYVSWDMTYRQNPNNSHVQTHFAVPAGGGTISTGPVPPNVLVANMSMGRVTYNNWGSLNGSASISDNDGRNNVGDMPYAGFLVSSCDSNHVLSFGEEHYRWHDYSTWYSSGPPDGAYLPFGWDPSRRTQSGSYYPARRLNSSVDNIQLFLGDSALAGFGNAVGSFIKDWVPVDSALQAHNTRYDLVGDPAFVVDLRRANLALGSRIISLSARVHEPPLLDQERFGLHPMMQRMHESDPVNYNPYPGPEGNFPKLTLSLDHGSGVVLPARQTLSGFTQEFNSSRMSTNSVVRAQWHNVQQDGVSPLINDTVNGWWSDIPWLTELVVESRFPQYKVIEFRRD